MSESNKSKLVTIREVKENSFIFEKENALATEFCEEAIQRFESNQQDQYQGRIGQMADQDNSIKKSTDLVVSGKQHWHDVDRALFKSLGIAIREFRAQYPYFNGPFKDMGYGLQRTDPGEYYHWHIDGGSHDFSHRQLVAIWYLNDVEGPGGETEFSFQDVQIKPQAGKLLLFPPFWTHEHRGVTLESGVKYIATTWVVFA
jgi:Rps23 Pro-64 3,4-dihydroxylase Tpa1-like proline 4-hydroxylase|tara:strand:- start:382 stop:984 length:603 start_codon:yes stop_codon:yes gene_type:complete